MRDPFISIEKAIAHIQQGGMIILVDDENRENEGDLVIAAQYVTEQSINFMSKFGRGLICLPMSEQLIDKLELPLMTTNNRSPYGTAFTISIEARTGVTTGISARDRARTVQVAIDPTSGANDIVSPGHIFPLRARPKGVLERTGQTEGSVDLMRLAGLPEAAVICEIMNDSGAMSRRQELAELSEQHNLPMVCIKDLIDYRVRHETLIEPVAASRVPLQNYGDFTMTVFANQFDKAEHFALVKQPTNTNQVPLVRIHSECVTGDVFGSLKCDCGSQLQHSLEYIAAQGGILVYLRQEGRGLGLANKLKAYELQEQGLDTVEANLVLGLPIDNRNYAIAFQILKYFGIESLRLLTNNPEKVEAIAQYGLKVCERIALEMQASVENHGYLKAKKEKLGHLLMVQ